MTALLTDPASWVSLLTLTAMEIVLGIDNVVFLVILAGRLPPDQQPMARRLGLALALGTRLLLLLAITWLMGLTRELFRVLGHGYTGRDLILLGGGLFLLGKATFEIHDSLEVRHEEKARPAAGPGAFGLVLAQIALLDLVFSLDSVITAVGLVDDLAVMVLAVLIAVGVMLIAARPIGEFVDRHPTFKLLALAFLVLIGVALIAEGFDTHLPKGYIYFAMAFAVAMEILNMRMRARRARRAAPVKLRHEIPGERHRGPPGDD
jgi:predicted tellurium resistance membrane protein TerC